MEDILLSLNTIDVEFNKRKILVNMRNHIDHNQDINFQEPQHGDQPNNESTIEKVNAEMLLREEPPHGHAPSNQNTKEQPNSKIFQEKGRTKTTFKMTQQ